MKVIALLTLALASAGALAQQPARILREGPAQSPIASSVRVPAAMELVYISGTVPDAVKAAAPQGTIERYGDTEAQTRSVLNKMEQELRKHGLGLGDIVMMRVFLVAPPGKQQ